MFSILPVGEKRLYMKAISAVLLICFVAVVHAQEDPVPVTLPVAQETPPTIKVQDMEWLTITALRKEFPRLSGIFASAQSCRLPDYGPFVSVTIQLPAYYFTRPVLQELDKRQRVAEEQARRVRVQLERAAQLITLRAKEAGLMEKIEWEVSAKKKSVGVLDDLQGQLHDIRQTLQTMEAEQPEILVIEESTMLVNEVDLNKLLAANYQQLILRIAKAMKNSLAENAPRIIDLGTTERVGVNAYIRDSILGSQGKSLLFILHNNDIQAYRSGEIDLGALRERVIVKDAN